MNGLVKLTVSILLLCNIDRVFSIICDEDHFLCADGRKCIRSSNLCDYEADCEDSSDELNFALCKELQTHRSNCRSGEVDCYDYCYNVAYACRRDCISSSSICHELQNNRLKPNMMYERSLKETSPEDISNFYKLLEFISEAFNETIKRNFTACPPFYTLFQDKCFSFFTPAQIKWSEAKQFCESTSGRLAVLDDIKKFKDALDYIHSKELEANFWIGGKGNDNSSRQENSTNAWTWLNNEAIEMGAPFWSLGIPQATSGILVCSDREIMTMRPKINSRGEKCLALLKKNHYYFSDEDCNSNFSPVCITDKRM